jgi:hypothetical protein
MTSERLQIHEGEGLGLSSFLSCGRDAPVRYRRLYKREGPSSLWEESSSRGPIRVLKQGVAGG